MIEGFRLIPDPPQVAARELTWRGSFDRLELYQEAGSRQEDGRGHCCALERIMAMVQSRLIFSSDSSEAVIGAGSSVSLLVLVQFLATGSRVQAGGGRLRTLAASLDVIVQGALPTSRFQPRARTVSFCLFLPACLVSGQHGPTAARCRHCAWI